jgi:hypothetical protein
MRSDRKLLPAFLAAGSLFLLFLLLAVGPLGADRPRPSELVSPVVRAEDLAAAFAENSDEAEREYRGRAIAVSGEWQAIRPLADGPGLLLELKAGAGLHVYCRFEGVAVEDRKEFESRLLELVRVRGRCVGRDGDGVVLRECTLLD